MEITVAYYGILWYGNWRDKLSNVFFGSYVVQVFCQTGALGIWRLERTWNNLHALFWYKGHNALTYSSDGFQVTVLA